MNSDGHAENPQSTLQRRAHISVIIPAYNSKHRIGICLDAMLGQQEVAGGIEVIVIDDGSTDGTSRAVADYVAKDTRVRLLIQPNAGPAAARNHGARMARGEFLLFTDSDCVPEPDWISQMLKPFGGNPEISAVKGAYKTHQTGVVARFAQMEFEERYRKLAARPEIDFVDTYAMAIRASAFWEIGGFDTSFPTANNEDVELSYRLASRGHKIRFNPDAVVFHHHPDTFFSYLKTKFGRAYWRMAVYRSFPEKIGYDSYTPQSLKVQILAAFLTLAALVAAPFAFGGRIAAIFGAAFFLLFCVPFVAGAFRCRVFQNLAETLARIFKAGFFKRIRETFASCGAVKLVSGLVAGAERLSVRVLRSVFGGMRTLWRSSPVRIFRSVTTGSIHCLVRACLAFVSGVIRAISLARNGVATLLRALASAFCRVARIPPIPAIWRALTALARSPVGMVPISLVLLFLRAVVMGLGVLWGLRAQNARKGRFSELVVLLVSDSIALSLALVGAPYAAFHVFGAATAEPGDVVMAHFEQLPFFLVIALAVFALSGLYVSRRGLSQVNEFAVLTKAVLAVAVIGYAAASLAATPPSLMVAAIVALSALVLLYILRGRGRALVDKLPRARRDDTRTPALIVGTGEVAVLIFRKLTMNRETEASVVGMVSEDPALAGTEVSGCPVVGSFDDIEKLIAERNVKDVFVALPSHPQDSILEIVNRHSAKNGARFHVVATLCDLITAEVDMASSDTIPIVHLKNESLALIQMAVKRIFDFVVALVLLLVTLPFWILIVVAIKLETDGPAIFTQDRVGKNGRRFRIFKFRTMDVRTDQYAYSPSAPQDKRITAVGAFLRRTSLDEFPQLLNVIRGDMSLVGPRPEMPFIVEGYKDWQRQRLTVKPGITGLWQIMGRKDLPLHENIEYDFYYIKNQSLLLDLSILIKTIPVVLRKNGAY